MPHTVPNRPFLGRYQLQKKLAVGGMAEIYLATMQGAGGFEKQVVVKRILPQLAESEAHFQSFLDEARISATLQHPNVIQVYDACEENGEYFMAMEFLDGSDLRGLQRVVGEQNAPAALPIEHTLHIISNVAAGMHYAHEKCDREGTPLHIVHRDVSPDNVFVTREGGVKLGDFGIAQTQTPKTGGTALGTLRGKLNYMSPEQCQSEQIDKRSDIYSLGVILYELSTGRRLYKSTTEYQLINEIVTGAVDRPSSFMEYPHGLEEIVMKCLARDLGRRYATARELQIALQDFASAQHLQCSALALSTYLKPFLDQVDLYAEERWKQRKVAPIRLGDSGAVGILPEAPETMVDAFEENSEPPEDEATRIMRDMSLTPEIHADNMTRRVPTDILARLRGEERELIADEKALRTNTGIPTVVLETSESVSTNVVKRGLPRAGTHSGVSDLELLLEEKRDEREASDHRKHKQRHKTEPVALPNAMVTPVADSAFVPDVDERALGMQALGLHVSKQVPKPQPSRLPSKTASRPETAGSTGNAVPQRFASTIETGALSVPRNMFLLWLMGGLAGAAVVTIIMAGKNSTTPAQITQATALPIRGSLIVDTQAGAKVWVYLGQTPVDTASSFTSSFVRQAPGQRIRIDHEGYDSVERDLGSQSWQHDESGNYFASASIVFLQSDAGSGDAATALTAAKVAGSVRPEQLRVVSQPTAAKVWLFIGTGPHLKFNDVPTAHEVELRVESNSRPPVFQLVRPSDFSTDGQATIEL